MTMCGHVFCYQCISSFLNGEVNSCPTSGCKDVLTPDSVLSGSTLRSCLSGEPMDSSLRIHHSPEEAICSSSKINAAMEILRSICTSSSESEPPVKAIVFSQWTSMLDFLEVSLNHSLIQYRRLDGSMSLSSRERAVRDFNTVPEVFFTFYFSFDFFLMTIYLIKMGSYLGMANHDRSELFKSRLVILSEYLRW